MSATVSADHEPPRSDLGAFSVSLAVKDIAASLAFYEKLGFTAFMGEEKRNWLIMRNGSTVIGLFQGMFDRNTLTFNPGWDQNASGLGSFTDVREVKHWLVEKGVAIAVDGVKSPSGPASFMVFDPDGNPILFDQHV